MSAAAGSAAEDRRERPRGGLARPLVSLLAALVCAAATAALAAYAVGTASGQRLDQLILSGSREGAGALPGLRGILEGAVTTVDTVGLAVVLGVVVLLVLLRGRPGRLVPLAVIVLGSNLTTQALKHLVLQREALGPGIEVTPNSFPSGHTTLAAAAAVALVLAAGRLRPVLAPLAAVWSAAAGVGTLVVGWHRPSDVVGGVLVVATWTFLVLGVRGVVVRRAAARPSTGSGRRRRGTSTGGRVARAPRSDLVAGLLMAAVGAGLLVLAALQGGAVDLPLRLEDLDQQRTAFVATATLVAGGTALWFALVLLLHGPEVGRSRRAGRVP